MAWTNIADSIIEVGKPIRALDIRNLRDNIPALANGDAGAPRIQQVALVNLAAGDVRTAYRYPQTSSVSATYVELNTGARIFVNGTIRVRGNHRAIGGGTSFLLVQKNFVTQAEWSTTSASDVGRVVDLSVAPGDFISVFNRTGGSGTSVVSGVVINTSGGNLIG